MEKLEVLSFDCIRGYGFAKSPECGDVFVHARLLRRAGILHLLPGDEIVGDVQKTSDGPRLMRVVSVDNRLRDDLDGYIKCVCKWFRKEDFYGFLLDSDFNEIFVHGSAVRDSGLVNSLVPGAVVLAQIEQQEGKPRATRVVAVKRENMPA